MVIDDIIARLNDRVPDLAGRVDGAAELAALVREHAMPSVTPAAFVLPLGLRPGGGEASTGFFQQMVQEVIGVVLVHRAHGDVTGGRALPTIDALVNAVIAAIAGWAPANETGVFLLARGRLYSLNDGLVLYQLDFSIANQLRITP